MAKIHQLSSTEIQKIAAGEVVDRPANIVKELVENALDAGADHLIVTIKDGGKEFIQVIDNGCGMDPIDARHCFDHHATSKLSSVDDLQQLTTFGFRGEALSSIAAVSNIELITKEKDAAVATRVVLEGAHLASQTEVAANTGSSITIRDLFFTIPARRKFLKSRETEYRQILLFMQSVVIAYQNVHIEFYADDELIFSCPAHESLVTRFVQLWDYSISQQMIQVQTDDMKKGIQVEGVVSRQHYMRYDRSAIFLFVNRRWVKNNHLMKALLKGYLNILPPARYPTAALFITVDPLLVDINVHPRKEEVKFLHPQQVESLLFNGVKEALERQLNKQTGVPSSESVVSSSDIMAEPWVAPMQEKIEAYRPAEDTTPKFVHDYTANRVINKPRIEIKQEEQPIYNSVIREQQSLLVTQSVQAQEMYKIIGQYKKTYIMLEQDQQLIFIDQHAAHERILYELFTSRFSEVAVVKLLFPLLVTVSREDASLAENHFSLFESHGLILDRFAEQQLRIMATPVHLQECSPQEIIKQIIGWIGECGQVESSSLHALLNEKIHAKMACVAAVKAGDVLTITQMERLVQDLYKTQNRITCPHGRPTTWQLDLAEIEKKFKRDYRSNMRGGAVDC